MLLLAGLLQVEQRIPEMARDPLCLFGQTALFFYVMHWMLLGGTAAALGLFRAGGLGMSYAAAGAVLFVMLPLCGRYLVYKRAHPRGWTRFL